MLRATSDLNIPMQIQGSSIEFGDDKQASCIAEIKLLTDGVSSVRVRKLGQRLPSWGHSIRGHQGNRAALITLVETHNSRGCVVGLEQAAAQRSCLSRGHLRNCQH